VPIVFKEGTSKMVKITVCQCRVKDSEMKGFFFFFLNSYYSPLT
jgi:hypothetical protein